MRAGLLALVLVVVVAVLVTASPHSAKKLSSLSPSKHASAHATQKLHSLRKRVVRTAAEVEPVTVGVATVALSQLTSLSGCSMTDDLVNELATGSTSSVSVVDGSTQLVWTSSKLSVDGPHEASLLPLSIRIDSRLGKLGTGTTLVFDVSDWVGTDAYETWLETYSPYSTEGSAKSSTSFHLSVHESVAAEGTTATSVTLEFSTSPDFGNPTDVQCASFSAACDDEDFAAACTAANDFLATATTDLPATTTDAIMELFASGSSLSSHSIRTKCFWIDSYLSVEPSAPSLPPTPPS